MLNEAKTRKPGLRLRLVSSLDVGCSMFEVGCSQILPFRKLLDPVPHLGERIAPVGCQVLRDAQRGEEGGVVRQDFRGRVAAVKLAQQPGNGLDDERFRITGEEAAAVAKL